ASSSLPTLNFFINALSFGVTSSLLKTFRIVNKIILTSNNTERLSTYHTSNRNRSSQLMLFLPLTCAHPVIPGLTSCLLDCSLLYKGKYSINNGRGPIKLISPFNTLNNCGNSSKLNFLMTFPVLVILSSFGNKLPRSSVSFVIVLNLLI